MSETGLVEVGNASDVLLALRTIVITMVRNPIVAKGLTCDDYLNLLQDARAFERSLMHVSSRGPLLRQEPTP